MALNQILGGHGLTSDPVGERNAIMEERRRQQQAENVQRQSLDMALRQSQDGNRLANQQFQAEQALKQQALDFQIQQAQQPVQPKFSLQQELFKQYQGGDNSAPVLTGLGMQPSLASATATSKESQSLNAELASSLGLVPTGLKGGVVTYGQDKETTAQTKAPSDAQYTTALFANRVEQAEQVFDGIKDYIENLPVVGTRLSEYAPNFAKDTRYQQFDQAKRNFVNAVLRRESGAAIAPSEFESAEQQYFPQAGDKPKVIEQKRRNRKVAMQGLINAAGTAYKPYEDTPEIDGTPSGNVTVEWLD